MNISRNEHHVLHGLPLGDRILPDIETRLRRSARPALQSGGVTC